MNAAVLFPREELCTETTVISGFQIANGFDGVEIEGRADQFPSPVIQANWITGNEQGIYTRLSDDQRVYGAIRGNLITDNATHGVFAYVSDDLCVFGADIVDNRIERNGTDGVRCRAFENQGGPDTAYCMPTIRGNLIAGNGSDGIDCKTGTDGVCMLTVENNVIADNLAWGMHRIHEGRLQLDQLPAGGQQPNLRKRRGGRIFHHGGQPAQRYAHVGQQHHCR